MKILAFSLALICGFCIWSIPLTLVGLLQLRGLLITIPLMFLLFWLIKIFYKFFIKKFGYEVIEKKDK